MNVPRDIYIIGAGGVTSYLLPPLLKTLSQVRVPPKVIIFDGDNLEARNLERQLFSRSDAKKKLNKARSLAITYAKEYPEGHLNFVPAYFDDGIEVEEGSLFFVCVDNHVARRAVLSVCDRQFCNAIIAANEYTDSQAIWYDCAKSGTKMDPRVRYPEILTDESEDPRRPESCTSATALAAAPQLAIANFAAASHALQLFWFYHQVITQLHEETRPHWPIEHANNLNKLTTRSEALYG